MHKMAVDAVVTVLRTCGAVGAMLSAAHASGKRKNQVYVLQVFQNVCFLSW